MKFDAEFFGPAEGNLAAPPGTFIRQTTTRQGGDYAWSRPYIPAASILLSNMRAFPDEEYPIATLDSFAAFADTPPVAATGNFWQDNISGVVRTFTPAAAAAIGGKNAALMQQYLQGNLPGYQLNSQGQLMKKSPPWIPIAIAGAGVLVLVLFMAKRK